MDVEVHIFVIKYK